MTRSGSSALYVDVATAGCCARVIDRRSAEEHHCRNDVTWAGVVVPQCAGHVNRPAAAFSCDEHRNLLSDPAPYGSQAAHLREMTRRRRRDVWKG